VTQPRTRSTRKDDSDPTGLREILGVLRQVQGDYHGARSMFRGIQDRFARREMEIEQFRKQAVIRRSSSLLLQAVGTRQLGSPPQTHLLAVNLLGSCRVAIDGQPITDWRGGKVRALFKYLVSHRERRIPREQLMEALWPGGDPQAAGNSLRVAVHALRQILHASTANRERYNFILFEDNAYAFGPRLEFWVDIEEFEHHWQAGRQLEKSGGLDSAREEYEAAESLYRGDFLDDDPYEEWTLLRREGLKDIQLTILGKLGKHFLESNDYPACIARCQKIVESDPCREDAYQWLMRCHAALGHPGRAHRWYELCVRALGQDLNLEPSRETMELHQQILDPGRITGN